MLGTRVLLIKRSRKSFFENYDINYSVLFKKVSQSYALIIFLMLSGCGDEQATRETQLLDAASSQTWILNGIYKNTRSKRKHLEDLHNKRNILSFAIHNLKEAESFYKKINVDGFVANLFGGTPLAYNNFLLELITDSSGSDLELTEFFTKNAIYYYLLYSSCDEIPVGTHEYYMRQNSLLKRLGYVGKLKLIMKDTFEETIKDWNEEMGVLIEEINSLK